MADTWNYTGHALYRHTDGTTLSQAVKENMGDPVWKTYYWLPGPSEKKKESFEDSQQEGVRSTQEVGLDHSSEEVR
jgi:hypothetical protein